MINLYLTESRVHMHSQSKQLKHGVSIVADLTKEEDMIRAVKETIEKLGGLDILINRCMHG